MTGGAASMMLGRSHMGKPFHSSGSENGAGGASCGGAGAHGVELTDVTGRVPTPDLEWIGAYARAALEHLGLRGVVRVKIVDDAEMTAAHAEYLEDPTTTDVLTFDMSEDGVLDVDILACVDVAERKGRELGHATARELLLYVVHGVLHCAGYDDHDDESRRRMHDREDEVLARIGAGATYHREGTKP